MSHADGNHASVESDISVGSTLIGWRRIAFLACLRFAIVGQNKVKRGVLNFRFERLR